MLVTTIDALGHLLNRIITAQWEGMGDVGSARYELALLPPCPTIRVDNQLCWLSSCFAIAIQLILGEVSVALSL